MIKRRYAPTGPTLLGTYTWPTGHQDMYLPQYFEEGVCTTHGNYRWQNPVGVTGGTFLMARTEHNYGMSGLSMTDGPYSYHGLITASAPSIGLPDIIPTGQEYMVDLYGRMKPAQPDFDFFNAAAELREVPPSVPGYQDWTKKLQNRFNEDIRGASNGYVAMQFGWLPLFNDISKLVDATRNITKKVDQTIRDNGKSVRRRRTIMNDVSSTTTSLSGYNLFHPVLQSGWYGSQPTGSQTIQITDRVWGVASFRYHLPEAPRGVDFRSYIAARAYGMRISPSVIYNAVPWSWMADYFSNLGTIISNADPGIADTLAADYFYVMRETEKLVTRTASCNMWGTTSYDNHVQVSSTSRLVTKSRLLGSPFGNGLEINSDLSSRQWSILGALGVSKWDPR